MTRRKVKRLEYFWRHSTCTWATGMAFLEATVKQITFHNGHSHVLTVMQWNSAIWQASKMSNVCLFKILPKRFLYQHKKLLLQLSIKTFLWSCGRFWQNFKQAVTALLWNKPNELGLILIIPFGKGEDRLAILDLTWLADQSTGSTTHSHKMTPIWLEQAAAQ